MTQALDRRRLLLALGLLAAPTAGLAEERKKGGGETFIQIQTLPATVIRTAGRRGVMPVESGVDVPDASLHERAMASTPRLRAAFAQMLQIYAAGLPPG